MNPRVAILQLFHEASAILPDRVTLQDFRARHWLSGDDVASTFGETKNWIGGVLSALKDRRVAPQIGLCTAALPGGPMAQSDFAQLRAQMLDSLGQILSRGPLDHLLLLLHGALLADGQDDPEGALVARMRAMVGPDTRISVALDFHANPGPALLRAANLVIGGKLYPHTDTRDRGARLVELAFDPRPLKTRAVALGLTVPMPHQQTVDGAFARLAALSDRLESDAVADVTLLGGFPFSPRAETRLLVTESAPDAAGAAAARMRKALEPLRGALTAPVPGIGEAMANVTRALPRGRVVVADVGDNPGGGGAGDDRGLLAALVGLDRPFAHAFLIDPALVVQAHQAGAGGRLELDLPGGVRSATVVALPRIAYRNEGPMMTGEVLDGGTGAHLRIGAGDLLVSSRRVQAYDSAAFRALGLRPEDFEILAVKSTAHFRAAFTQLATGGIVLADGGGLSSPLRATRSEQTDHGNNATNIFNRSEHVTIVPKARDLPSN